MTAHRRFGTATLGGVGSWPGWRRSRRWPLGAHRDLGEPSLFGPTTLLEASRRQRGLPPLGVPAVCVLDPDGDLVALAAASGGSVHPGWACYHSTMWVLETGEGPVGVVGQAVGAPFAVLVAEQLAASGAQLVISLSSAGLISRPAAGGPANTGPATFLVIDRALRDEGTSAHYVPPGRWSSLSQSLRHSLVGAFDALPFPVDVGASWTTDAPYRETSGSIRAAAAAGAVCVEMEAAALYAYAAARGRDVVCLAQLTNEPGRDGQDFDKGPRNGVGGALSVIEAVISALRHPPERQRTVSFDPVVEA